MNKVHLIRVMLLSLVLFYIPLSNAITVDGDKKLALQDRAAISAVKYLQLMQHAYQTKNYEITYLSSLNKQLEPMQLIHGVMEGQEVSYFRYLNGAIRESLQYANKISYFEQGKPVYTLASSHHRYAFSNIANFDHVKGQSNYDYVIVGKDRIAGKLAIAIRIISKDEYRYSYMIWCDLASFLPLRLDTLSPKKGAVEQLMVVSLKSSEHINPWLVKLTQSPRPETVHVQAGKKDKQALWSVGWRPAGFSIVKKDQHNLVMNDDEILSYIMLEDGLSTVSIYISKKALALDEKQKLVYSGATLLYTEQRGAIEINIIGDIPVITAQKLAKSISLAQK